ncbi:MAG: hypothetical protein IIA98_05175 [Proteobacteria bacterium]|nr:hypothetical protein [Pseudomonadota bacterium]
MIHTDTKILSLAAALLLCFGTYALAAPPEGKGKPPKGNQPVDATAAFTGDIISMGLEDGSGRLQGELVNNGGFDTMNGQLVMGETITIGGDAGAGLAELDDPDYSILPTGATVMCNGNCSVLFAVLLDDENSGVTWTIRLDRDKEPPNRVQFKMRWLNAAGLEHHLRIGWVVQAYEDEIYPLPPGEYGDTGGDTSLASATVIFYRDFFRIDGDVVVPSKGKKTKTKTELEVFSHYGELYDDTVSPTIAPWCAMGGISGEPDPADPNNTIFPCRESTTIETNLGTTTP